MACRGRNQTAGTVQNIQAVQNTEGEFAAVKGTDNVERLLFGVDSRTPSGTALQNNLTQFEWVVRNKIYPNFWGRNLVGENALTRDEIEFIHSKGCKIAAIYIADEAKETEEQGKILAKKIALTALELGVPAGAAVFLEVDEKENITAEYMRALAQALLFEGFTPGFKANTDAVYSFDREYSRGMQSDRELFEKCLVWAVAPSLEEYDHITTSHLIRPDNWIPYAPSGITRRDIALWQYGKNCHPIQDDEGNDTSFNLNLVRNEEVIIHKMF